MKNKNFTRFLCFFMCFCLCFAWFGPSIEAQAAGGIVAFLGLLAAFMAAHGAGLAASGAADSLRNGMEGWAEEYVAYANESGVWDWTFSEWVQQIMNDVFINNAGYFALGAVAVKYLNDFMEWLQGELTPGVSCSTDSVAIRALPIVDNNGNQLYASSYSYDSSTGSYVLTSEGTLFSSAAFPLTLTDSIYTDYTIKLIYEDSAYMIQGQDPSGKSLGFNCLLDRTFHNTYHGYSDILFYGIDTFFTYSYPVYYYNYAVYLHYSDGCVGRAEYAFTGKQNWQTEVVSTNSTGSLILSSFDPVDSDASDFGSMVLNTGALVADDPTNKDDYSSSIFGAIVSGDFSASREVISGEVTDDPVITDPSIESDGTMEGNISGIFSGVQALIELIKSIPSLILDGIKSIFIPDPDDMNDQFMALLEEINDTYAFDFDLESLFSGEKEPDDITAVYSVGPLSWDLTFVSWYYLKKGVAYFRPYIRGFIVLLLVFFQLRQFMACLNMVALDGPLGSFFSGDSSTALVVKESRGSGGVIKK